jgi:hypothetical protein
LSSETPQVVRPTNTIKTAAYPAVAARVWSFAVLNVKEQQHANKTTATDVVIKAFPLDLWKDIMIMGARMLTAPNMAMMKRESFSIAGETSRGI